MLKKLARFILNHLPTKNVILFESIPDLSDNTKPVFDEMIKRGINKKHKMIWMCYDPIDHPYPKTKNVRYFSTAKHRIQTVYLLHTARWIVCCNRFLGVKRKGQTIFYFCHGSPIKDTSDYYLMPDKIKYIFTQGAIFTEAVAQCFRRSVNGIYPFGFPRNDAFLETPIDLNQYFGPHKKYIVWYPTVRQFKGGIITGSSFALPIIHDLQNVVELNECAKEKDVLIILKPHFAQSMDRIKEMKLSNLIFINDDFFKEHAVSSYRFVASTDALLTDYSSIYYDYLLCDKPIGLIWEDIDEYAVNPGLVPNYKEWCEGGEKIFNISELKQFVERVADGIDLKKQQRNILNDKVNVSSQKDVTKNVTDFILREGEITLGRNK